MSVNIYFQNHLFFYNIRITLIVEWLDYSLHLLL